MSICNNGYYINRWHGGDSNGAELGMYKECDENSIWRMHFIKGKKLTVVFDFHKIAVENERPYLNLDTHSNTKLHLWGGEKAWTWDSNQWVLVPVN